MVSIKETHFYDDVIKEFNYSFCNIFLFDGFFISEINEGVTFTWDDHASVIARDLSDFTGTNGDELTYISHRIHSYAVRPNDWLKFFNQSYSLKSYGVVSYTQGSILNIVVENLFLKKKIKRFDNLESAVQWATNKVLLEFED